MAALSRSKQRFDVRAQQTRLEPFQQPLHGQQCMDFRVAEPQAGQLLQGKRLVVAIAVALAVPDDGNVEPAAHVFEVALESSQRNFQLAQETPHRNATVLSQQLLDAVEALGAIHT